MRPVQDRLQWVPVTVAVVALSAFVLGCSAGSADLNSGADPGQGIDFGPANVPLPPGEWAATGIVQRGPEASNQPPGTMLKRPWSFRKRCDPACRILFLRWTLYGPSVTRLVAHGGFFTAKFPPVRVPCVYPRGSSYVRHPYGESHDSYRLWWSADGRRIDAVEHRVETGCYPTPEPPDLTRWTAVRARPSGAPAGARS
jgi:hypothetical protein